MFHFQQFSVKHEKNALKVGTDSVLLGTWTPLHNPKNALDIGAGTGILSLILAQRCPIIRVDAVEIHSESYQECVENIQNSPWNTRIHCFNKDIQAFAETHSNSYDLIITNPPFYSESTHSKDEKRALARSIASLSFPKLLQITRKLLATNGFFSLILPYKEEENFCQMAEKEHLFLHSRTRVRGNTTSDIKRSLLLFSSEETQIHSDNELSIEIERHKYTPEYTQLTKDFYLKR